MSGARAWGVFAAGAALGVSLAAGTFFGGRRIDAEAARPALPDISSSRRNAIVVAAQKASPAVVTVSVVSTRVVRTDPFGFPLRDEFFDRFFPPSEYRERIPGLGSGVIVDSRGTVVTNEHVVRNAEAIEVHLSDGRKYSAKLLGATPLYDLAVLELAGAKDLPVARLGTSDSLVVGEWAIAIGNPFGNLLTDTQPTVTAGVISATRRDIKAEATESGVYKNMIQTDAAINPGNSGGALVNSDGDVIGINTFIFTSGGGSIGLGFAIPIDLVKQVLGEIRQFGRVRIAWPGMQVQPVTDILARRLGWADAGGLVVTRVDPDGPAARAGVRVGDRVRRVNSRVTNSVDDAQRSIYGAQVGDQLLLEIERGTRTLRVSVVLEEAPRR